MAVYALAALLLFRMLTLDLSNESSATGRKTARGIRSATWSAKRGAHGCVSSAREQQRDRESKNVPRLASRCPRWTPRCSPARTCSRCPRSSRATAVTSRRSSTAKHPPPSAARTGWSGIQTPKGSGNGFCRQNRRVGRGGAPRSLVEVASESERKSPRRCARSASGAARLRVGWSRPRKEGGPRSSLAAWCGVARRAVETLLPTAYRETLDLTNRSAEQECGKFGPKQKDNVPSQNLPICGKSGIMRCSSHRPSISGLFWPEISRPVS